MNRVLVDLLFMSGNKGGMETYVRETYQRIRRYSGDLEFVALASTELCESGDTDWFPGEIVPSRISSRNRVSLALGESLSLDRYIKKAGANLVHSPANFGSWSRNIPTVLTLHDALSYARPDLVPGVHGVFIRSMIRKTASAARHILTVSESSKLDIQHYLGINPNRISVVPLAGTSSHSISNREERSDSLLLCVGNNLPHKNFKLVLEAISLLSESSRPQVRFVGGNGEGLSKIIASLALEPWAKHLGWVSPSELSDHYSKATLFVLPTQFEGFGLPVLEAMSSGCPVLCSDIAVLREVGADAAVYFDNKDPSDLARKFEQLRSDPLKLKQMSRSGLDQSGKFDWDITAQGTAAVLNDFFLARMQR